VVYWFSLFRFSDQRKTPLRKQGLALTIKMRREFSLPHFLRL